MAFKYKGSSVLLLEGINDCHVVSSLCKIHNIPDDIFGLYECGSDTQVLKRLSALIHGAIEIDTIGVVIDADTSIQDRWRSISERLRRDGYDVPDSPNQDGTIIELEGFPKIGIWVMPDNNVNGMLEDFCHRLLDQDLIDHVRTTVLDAKNAGFSTYKQTHESKAIIHTALAWQDEPGLPLGQSVTRKTLNPTSPIANTFVGFLSSIFI